MGSRPHRRYSTEFKLQHVHAYVDAEGRVKSIATPDTGSAIRCCFCGWKHRRGALTEEVHL